MEAYAIAKGVRISPRKARLVIDLIRGKSVIEAHNILKNYNSDAARYTIKVLDSAVANAENNLGLKKENVPKWVRLSTEISCIICLKILLGSTKRTIISAFPMMSLNSFWTSF